MISQPNSNLSYLQTSRAIAGKKLFEDQVFPVHHVAPPISYPSSYGLRCPRCRRPIDGA